VSSLLPFLPSVVDVAGGHVPQSVEFGRHAATSVLMARYF